jgi:ABC-type Na+ transport system ATPase subunit NatA
MDEASQCDSLRFIRGGQLLAAGTEHEILRRTHAKTMEDAFLTLAEQTPRQLAGATG